MTLATPEAPSIAGSESPMTLLAPLALACIETTLNRMLARDPAAPSRLERLAGKRIVVRLEHPEMVCLALFQADGISLARLDDVDEGDADAVIELSLETLAQMAAGHAAEQLMFDGELAVRGDMRLLNDVQTLLKDLDVDWEGALFNTVGKGPGQALATGIKRLGAFGIRTRQQLHADLYEYTFEQARLLAGRDQLDKARHELTQLEIATDRVEARFTRIQKHLARQHSGGETE